MHTRRLITFLLGAWLAAIVLVGGFATENFRVADRITDIPAAAAKKAFDKIGREASLQLVRHNVSEINRSMFELSEWIQISIGVGIIVIVIFSRRHSKERVLATIIVTGIMLGIVLLQRFLFTPEMIGTGRLLDFGEASDVGRERQVFGTLHAVYGLAEVAKGLLGFIFVAFLLKARTYPSIGSRRSKQIDAVDESDYSHVDG